jgi:hypothetical protein
VAAGYWLDFAWCDCLQDALLPNQTLASLRAVMAPKTAAKDALQAHQAAQPLRQLVLFSSVASLVGAAGQGNYVAANAVLDAWAAQAAAQGVAASSIQWGAWASAGALVPRPDAQRLQ